jgi:signal transduction histidine kinase
MGSRPEPLYNSVAQRQQRVAIRVPSHLDGNFTDGIVSPGSQKSRTYRPSGTWTVRPVRKRRTLDLQSNIAILPRSDREGNQPRSRRPVHRPAERRRDGMRAVLAERKRLSRELHDAVGQSLTALLMQIRLARARGTASVADLQLLEITAQQALDQARALAYGLRETQHDPLGEVRRLAEHLLGEQGCVLVWVDDRTDLDMTAGVARDVAAAIKESVTNIACHAQADQAEIRLESPLSSLRVTIEDNGVGFRPELVRLSPDGRGLGLLGMAERLEGLGGSVVVISRPGMGTRVVLEADRGSGDASEWQIPEAVTAGV